MRRDSIITFVLVVVAGVGAAMLVPQQPASLGLTLIVVSIIVAIRERSNTV